jgi:hypothetical protein
MALRGGALPVPETEGFIVSQTLPLVLDALIFRGNCARGEVSGSWEFLLELAESPLSDEQASALCDVLGISDAERDAAVQRARGSN